VWIATRKPKVDFVLVTGDFARRSRADELVRNQSDQTAEIIVVSELLVSLVAEPMIVLPAIGGSDLFPEGDCGVSDPQFALLQSSIWESLLRPWLTTAESKNNFLQYGCYNVTYNGFGIIVLNTEFWSFSNGVAGASTCDDDRVGHKVFQWAESILEGYKQQGMKVLITGNRKYYDEYGESDGYRPKCLARYVNMSVVYESSILGHVFGGAHEDTFNLIQNNVDFFKPNVTGVVHVSPAVVPVKNPAVRIYEYATAGSGLPPGTLTDYVQYYADIVQANIAAELAFKLEYRATTAYGLPDFSTASWLSFFGRLETDATLKRTYDLYKSVSADATGPTPAMAPPDTLIGVVFTVICGVLVILAGALAWYKCRSFKHKTYEQELAEGLR
jgi:hypothetical protein